MIKRTFKLGTWLMGLFVFINMCLGLVTNVPTHVTTSDAAIFRTALNLVRSVQPMSYEQEIALIQSVQGIVLTQAPVGKPIPEYADREPEDLLMNKSGLCYDRSRTYDKLYSWLGFEVRHIYILYPEHPETKDRLPFWRAFFTSGTVSHAVTEIKTSRGWLLVDSNSAWIGVTREGEPVSADHLHARAKEFATIPNYFDRDYWAIRGLYSRRGQFYRPFIPYPQLNWVDFWSWALGIS
jgi:hypothetical protein